MRTIQETVGELLKSRPYLEEAIQDGLINLTALANQMITDVERILLKPVKTGALVMAIKRHQSGKLPMINIKATNLLKNLSNIIVRSNISVHTYENSVSLPNSLAELSVGLSKQKGLFYTFSQGVFETTIIINNSAEQELKEKLKHENLLSSNFKLACITLYLPDENTEIPGYYYFILKKIAWEGINIIEVLSTSNEFSLILEDKNVDRAFSILKNSEPEGIED